MCDARRNSRKTSSSSNECPPGVATCIRLNSGRPTCAWFHNDLLIADHVPSIGVSAGFRVLKSQTVGNPQMLITFMRKAIALNFHAYTIECPFLPKQQKK
ncbi:hypothetical protein TNCV_2752141 [Trichonephila clavipes]|nr:hypothetical protein TNCV_2752141 [Trichonephila clavipes]